MSNFPDFSPHGYEVESELGHNRSGGRVTYLATSTRDKQKVVIKQFQFAQAGASWSEYDAYDREIQVLRSLHHPSIPQYLDSFQTNSGFCMVQEYKPAPSLRETTRLTPNEVKQLAISILDILVYLQSQITPVIHRDIKPENILVARQQPMQVYLVDFGFARMGGGEVAVSSVVKGTLGFMPPEQMFNRQLTQASDLYSLGATLICLLTGTPSAEIGNLVDSNCRINFKSLVSQLNPRFIEWLQKMVAPNLKDRYSNAAEALKVLNQIDIYAMIPKRWIPVSAALATTIGLVGLGAGLMLRDEVSNISEPASNTAQSTLEPGYKVRFTTELNNKYKPTKNLQEISMAQKRVYFYVGFDLLPDKEYDASCQIIDGVGDIVYAGQSTLVAEGNSLETWCSHDFKSQVDKPGQWIFEYYLDGQKVVNSNLTVSP